MTEYPRDIEEEPLNVLSFLQGSEAHSFESLRGILLHHLQKHGGLTIHLPSEGAMTLYYEKKRVCGRHQAEERFPILTIDHKDTRASSSVELGHLSPDEVLDYFFEQYTALCTSSVPIAAAQEEVQTKIRRETLPQ